GCHCGRCWRTWRVVGERANCGAPVDSVDTLTGSSSNIAAAAITGKKSISRGGRVVIPHSYVAALLMTLLTMMCWGSWANVVKIVGEWRFELLYYDYALGILITSIFAGLTLGSMGSYGKPFLADLNDAGGANIAFGFMGGVVYSFSNILIVGAIAVAGLGVAFPIGVGLALVVG